MARKIAIANLKGGTGKTNIAVNLSMFLTALGKRVLLIDLTLTADASFCLAVKSPNFVGDVLLQKIRPGLCLKSTAYFGFDIMPSSLKMAETIKSLEIVKKPELRLKAAIENLEEDYDFIIIDTPPEFSLFTKNALFAADELIIPIQAEHLALRSAEKFLKLIEPFKKKLKLKRVGGLITMYAWRSRLSRSIAKRVRDDFPGYVFSTTIPRAAILAQLPELKEPVLKTAPNSRPARAYRQLAEEVMGQE